MRAIEVRELLPDHAGVALADRPIPVPGPGEVRVRVRAAAVNLPDLLMTSGGYQLKTELHFVSGLEFAGEVDAVGEEDRKSVVKGTSVDVHVVHGGCRVIKKNKNH